MVWKKEQCELDAKFIRVKISWNTPYMYYKITAQRGGGEGVVPFKGVEDSYVYL